MRSSLAFGLLLALVGCGISPQQSRAPAPYQPLNAHITALTPGGPLFHVNRPAYVAMFYIAPGSGVSMLYPGLGSGSLNGRAFAGTQFATMRLNNQSQYIFTRASSMQPRYYFLVASERPLNISQFGAFGDGLRGQLGSSFASFSAFDTMEEIVRQALPGLPNDGSWTTDMYVDWPSVIHAGPGDARVLLDCGGYSMYVARDYVAVVRSIICDPAREQAPRSSGDHPRQEPEEEAPAEEGSGGEGGADERAIQPRTRNALTRPGAAEVAASRTAESSIRQRISASSQLSPATPRERAWENALATQARGTVPRGAHTSGYPSGARDADTRATPAANRSPAPSATSGAGSTRAPVAPPAGVASSSGGGDGGTRSRPTPSQGN